MTDNDTKRSTDPYSSVEAAIDAERERADRFRAALVMVENCSNDPQIVAHVSKVLMGDA